MARSQDGSGDRKDRNGMTDAPGSDDRTVTEYEVQDVENANATGKQPVVFVHGLWLLPNSWDRWREVGLKSGSPVLRNPANRSRAVRPTYYQCKSGLGPIAGQ